MAEDLPFGPHKIALNGQVVIPKEILRQVRLAPGQSVYLMARQGIVELVPVDQMAKWYRSGRGDGTARGARQ